MGQPTLFLIFLGAEALFAQAQGRTFRNVQAPD